MSLCSAKINQTIKWAILDIPIGNLYYQNDKGLPDGFYFRFIAENTYGVKYEEILKYCKFIFTDSVGIYHKENDSYSGGYGLVQQSKVDSFARIVDYNLEDKFYFSNVAVSFNYFATQTIERKINDNIDSLSYLINLLIPSIEFSSFLIGSLIFYFAFLFFIKKFKLISKFIVKLLLSMFIIYLFFIENLYNSNINTSNLIVNTSDLINDVNDVIKTKRELCVYEKESADNDFYFKAPKYSFANQLNRKINHKNLCYLSDSNNKDVLGNILIKDQNRIFIFTFDLGRDFILKMIQTVFKRDLFISQKPIFGNLKSFIMPKTASKQLRNLFNKFVNMMLENGIVFSNKNIPNYSTVETIKFGEFSIYEGLQTYIEHFTITNAISFDKFDYLFRFYFGILILLIFIFIINLLAKNYFNYAKNLIIIN